MKTNIQKFLLLTTISALSFTAFAGRNGLPDIELPEEGHSPVSFFSPVDRGETSGVASVIVSSPSTDEALSRAAYLAARDTGFISIATTNALPGVLEDSVASSPSASYSDDDVESASGSASYIPTDEECVEDALDPSYWAAISKNNPQEVEIALQVLQDIEKSALKNNKQNQLQFSNLIWDIAKRIHKEQADTRTRLEHQLTEVQENAEQHLKKKFGFPHMWYALLEDTYRAFSDDLFTDPAAPEIDISEVFWPDEEYTSPHPVRSRPRVVQLFRELHQRLAHSQEIIKQMQPSPAKPAKQAIWTQAKECTQAILDILKETESMAAKTAALIDASSTEKQKLALPADRALDVSFLQDLRLRALQAQGGDMTAFWSLFNDAELEQWFSYETVTTQEEYDAFMTLKQLCVENTHWHFKVTQAIAMANPNVWQSLLASRPNSVKSDQFADESDSEGDTYSDDEDLE